MNGRPLLLITLSLLALDAQAQVYPGKSWATDPNGLSPTVLRRVKNYEQALDTTGLVIVKGGKIVFSYGNTTELSYLASSRKSVLSMLYGKYVENGTIDLKKTLADLNMDDNGGLLPIEKTATVRDLIMARSGVFHPASNGGDSSDADPPRGSVKPGTYWLYNNWDFNAAGAAFEKMTGKNIFDALRDDLAKPIQMQDFDRARQQKLGDLKASRYPAYHMWLSARDMARLGYLMLREGKWNGKQLVPAKWVKESTTAWTHASDMHPDSAKDVPYGYGYLWWVFDGAAARGPFAGAYTSMGAFGQYIGVMPKLDLVVAQKTVPVNRFASDADYYDLLKRLAGQKPASEVVIPILLKRGQPAALAAYQKILASPGALIADDSDLFSAGVSDRLAGKYSESEKVLKLNAALYPKSARTLIELGRTQAAAGEKAAAVATFGDVLKMDPNRGRAKVGLALLGEPVDGHSLVPVPAAQLQGYVGRYKSKDLRYIVAARNGHLYIREIDPMGDLNDEYEAFGDKAGGFYVPFDGTSVRFAEAGRKVTGIERTINGQVQAGAREGKR